MGSQNTRARGAIVATPATAPAAPTGFLLADLLLIRDLMRTARKYREAGDYEAVETERQASIMLNVVIRDVERAAS